MGKFLQKAFFQLEHKYFAKFFSAIRKMKYSFLGMKIGEGTNLPPVLITWPNRVIIGRNCHLEKGIYFKHDGIWGDGFSIEIGDNVFIGTQCEFNIRLNISVGNNSLIASGSRFIDHDHGIETDTLMRLQHGPEKEITIGQNVWIGCNVVVLKGVDIGDGAVIAAGAIVTKNVPGLEIWGGIPARKIGSRT